MLHQEGLTAPLWRESAPAGYIRLDLYFYSIPCYRYFSSYLG